MNDYYHQLTEAKKACNKKQLGYAMHLAAGQSKQDSLARSYGPHWLKRNSYAIERRHEELMQTPSGRYYALLTHPISQQVIAPYALARQEKLQLLSMAAVKAYQHSSMDITSKEGDKVTVLNEKALNTMIRAVSELNKMQGDHAAEQLEVKGTILAATISQGMEPEQATDLYKQVMKGARIKYTEEEKQALEHTEYQPIGAVYNQEAEVVDVDVDDTTEPQVAEEQKAQVEEAEEQAQHQIQRPQRRKHWKYDTGGSPADPRD